MELRKGGDVFDWYFLAMAQWQLGHKNEARKWYDKGVEWTDKIQPANVGVAPASAGSHRVARHNRAAAIERFRGTE